MAERAAEKPVLQKPPGYRDPRAAVARPPPRKAPLPPAFRRAGKPPPRRHRSERHCCRRVCCWLFLLLLVLALLVAATAAVAYLWFQPRFPAFQIEAVRPSRFNVSARADGTYLDASVGVGVRASNPNGKIALAYGESSGFIAVADRDGDVDIGWGSASGFVQERKNSTVMRFAASVRGMMVDDAVGSRLKAQFKSKEVRFAVEVRTRVGVRIGGKITGRMPIRLLCEAVSLKQLGRGGARPKCRINLLRWINLH